MTTQTAPQIQVTTPNDTDLVLTRELDAPRHLVWKAFTTPELLVRWFGPAGSPMVECEIDLRVGGEYRYVWSVPPDRHCAFGVFREIVAPERFTSTGRMSMNDQIFPGDSLKFHVFEERNGKTTVILTGRYDSKETRDFMAASGVADGTAQCYRQLDALLPKIA